MQKFGFIRAANIDPEWRRVCEPQASDFSRILELNFNHLLPSHDRPIIGSAKEEFTLTFNEIIGTQS